MHKAHEKIWLQVDPDGESYDPERHDLEDDCTWCKDQINDNDVAYIRADLVESLRQQLADSQKREVMLRDAILQFRNEPLLGRAHAIRRTKGYAAMGYAALDATEQKP